MTGARVLAALGLKTRTGHAIVVAVSGPVDAPEILGKTRIDVATTFEEGAVLHMGQELPIEEARRFVGDSEARFARRARAGLAAFVSGLDAKIVSAAMAAAPPKSLPNLESILRSHALVHTAEGELYRRVFAEGAAKVGPRPTRVP